MRIYLLFTLFLTTTLVIAQKANVPTIRSSGIKALNLSAEGEAQYKKDLELYVRVVEKERKNIRLTADEEAVYKRIDDNREDYWDAVGNACSWYCNAGHDTVYASSALPPQGVNTYRAKNAGDFSYKTAWVEGVPGYGIGQSLVYHFPNNLWPATTIIIANGYIKSEKAFTENSRVKKFNLYLNNKLIAILDLVDGRGIQSFTFEPFLYKSPEEKESSDNWTLKFEIADVYKGTKYDDTIISEIYFDGPHLH